MRSWLINLREQKKYLQKEVANLVGISQQYYNAIENGKRRPSPEVAKKIGELLGFDWTNFFQNNTKL